MGFTQSDIEDVEDAIRKILASGTDGGQVVTLQIDNRTTQYNYAKLPDLQNLLAQMRAEVSATNAAAGTTTSRRPRAYLVEFRRGL